MLGLSTSLLLLASCAKNTAVDRLAILPANVLVSEDASQWLKIGVPLVLQQDLMTARTLIPGVTLDESAAAQAKATKLLRTTVEKQQGGLRITATLTDTKTQKVLQTQGVDAASVTGVIAALNSLARKLDPSASDYSTGNLLALQEYLAAATTNDRQQRTHLLSQAITQDGGFGLAYIALIEMITSGPQTNVARFVEEAKTHRAKFSPYDRAKFDLAIARLTSAPAAEQIKLAQEALKFAPNDLDLLAVAGINQFLAGDSKAGEESLRHAISLNPANTGLQLQLGRGLMQARKLKEADTVLSSIEKNPAALPDLAVCVLLEGNTARADSIAGKLFSSIQSDEVKPLLKASWQVMSGQRQKGVDMLLAAKFSSPNVQSVALSEAALWQVMGHDYAGAKATIQRANAGVEQAASFPAVAAFLADKEGDSLDWQKRVNSSPLAANVKEPLIAYGLFLRGNYDDAAGQWKQILDRSHGTDLHARAMLASSLDHAGKKSQAHEIKVLPFVPEFGDLYAAIPFLEMRRDLGL